MEEFGEVGAERGTEVLPFQGQLDGGGPPARAVPARRGRWSVGGSHGGDLLSDPAPGPVARAAAVAYDGFLFVLGGADASGTSLTQVLVSAIQPDGSLTPFQATT